MITSARHISRQAAESLHNGTDTLIVSITDPDRELARIRTTDNRNFLRLQFHDVVQAIPSANPEYRPMTPAHASTLMNWLNRWHNTPEHLSLIVHCEAGVSRSAAVCRFVCERYLRIPATDAMVHYSDGEILKQLRFAAGWFDWLLSNKKDD